MNYLNYDFTNPLKKYSKTLVINLISVYYNYLDLSQS